MSKQINTIVCIDHSGSMSSSGSTQETKNDTALQVAQSNASQFVAAVATPALSATAGNPRSEDKLGVVGFATSVQTPFPLSHMNIRSNGLTALGAVQGMTAWGETNITDALSTSNNMLGNTGASNSIVLLTDGSNNVGGSTAIAPTGCAPIYSICLGLWTNESNLKNLANGTSGHYYRAPGVSQVGGIYNDIVAKAGISANITNHSGSVQPLRNTQATTTVSEGAKSIQIGATWTNHNLELVNGTPVGDQIAVGISGPSGAIIPSAPTWKGNGYAMFNINNPVPGEYTTRVVSSGKKYADVNVGAFDPSQKASLQYETVDDAKVGEPITVKCHVSDADDSKVENWELSGFVDSPTISAEEAKSAFKDELNALEFDNGDEAETVTDSQKMLALEAQRGYDNPVIPYVQEGLKIEQKQVENSFSFIPKTPGIHIVTIKGEGYAPVGGRGFSLVRVMTIVVS